MIRSKRGFVVQLGSLLFLALIGFLVLWLTGVIDIGSAASISKSNDVADKVATSCSGVQSVNALYNDVDAYKAGTDPAGTLTLTNANGDSFQKTVADDATSTTVPVQAHLVGLAGNNLGSPTSNYYAEPVEFDTVCSDVDVQPKLAKGSTAGTATTVNDNGATVNSVTNLENVAASSSYFMEYTLRSPADECASKHGAVIAIAYDATYIQKIEAVQGASAKGIQFLDSFGSTENASWDQYATFVVNKPVCDGEKATVLFKYTTTSSAGSLAGAANMNITWMGMNYDLDADTLELIGPAIYDETNNYIGLGKVSTIHYAE